MLKTLLGFLPLVFEFISLIVSLQGSFSCVCNEGYTGVATDGCVDIDECSMNNTCDVDTEKCDNTPGGYLCR